MSESRDYAIIVTVVGRFHEGSDVRGALEMLARTLNTMLPSLTGFVPGHPPVTVISSELMTKLPIGWPDLTKADE